MITTLLCFMISGNRGHPPEAGRRTTCKHNLTQLGLALHNYQDVHSVFPAPVAGTPQVSWRVAVLPYLDLKDLYQQYDQSKPWNAEPNATLAKRAPTVFHCPSNYHTGTHPQFTDYVMLTGSGTFGGAAAGRRKDDITDGMATTIAIVEATGLKIVWIAPRDFDAQTQAVGINLSGTGKVDSPGTLSSYHEHGAHVLMVDGTARFIDQSIDPSLLKKLITIAGEEDVMEEDLRLR